MIEICTQNGKSYELLEVGDKVSLNKRKYIIEKLYFGGAGKICLLSKTTKQIQDSDILPERIILKGIYKSEQNTENNKNIIYEMQAWSDLKDTNIVDLYAIGKVYNRKYQNNSHGEILELEKKYVAITEACDGSLRELLIRNRLFSPQKTVSIFTSIINGLKYANDKKGLIHLDLKPENILYTEKQNKYLTDQYENDITTIRFKITDWGISRSKQEESIVRSDYPPQILYDEEIKKILSKKLLNEKVPYDFLDGAGRLVNPAYKKITITIIRRIMENLETLKLAKKSDYYFYPNFDWLEVLFQELKEKKLNRLRYLIEAKNTLNNSGTCPYMAPERFTKGYPSSIQSDIFSLGIMLFEVLNGRRPYIDSTDVVQQITSGEYENLILASTDTDLKAFNKILSKMTSKDPKKRYENYNAIISDLSSIYIPYDGIVVSFKSAPIESEKKEEKLLRAIFAADCPIERLYLKSHSMLIGGHLRTEKETQFILKYVTELIENPVLETSKEFYNLYTDEIEQYRAIKLGLLLYLTRSIVSMKTFEELNKVHLLQSEIDKRLNNLLNYLSKYGNNLADERLSNDCESYILKSLLKNEKLQELSGSPSLLSTYIYYMSMIMATGTYMRIRPQDVHIRSLKNHPDLKKKQIIQISISYFSESDHRQNKINTRFAQAVVTSPKLHWPFVILTLQKEVHQQQELIPNQSETHKTFCLSACGVKYTDFENKTLHEDSEKSYQNILYNLKRNSPEKWDMIIPRLQMEKEHHWANARYIIKAIKKYWEKIEIEWPTKLRNKYQNPVSREYPMYSFEKNLGLVQLLNDCPDSILHFFLKTAANVEFDLL